MPGVVSGSLGFGNGESEGKAEFGCSGTTRDGSGFPGGVIAGEDIVEFFLGV
jgi:hypothetical protein